jgi:hypothetical protein
MTYRYSHQVRSPGAGPGLLVALGVLWLPAVPKRRRVSARLQLPGHRRRGAARRRGRHSAQQNPNDPPMRFEVGIFAAIAACS